MSSVHKSNVLEADFVVVGGAGTAGAVLAAHLSRDFSVIALDSGIDQSDNPLISDPLESGTLVREHTNEFFCGLGHSVKSSLGKVFPFVGGCVFGGGSAVNGMQYVRGTPEYFERVAERTGDSDWGAASAERVYRNLETFDGRGVVRPGVHGENGPVDVRMAANNRDAAQKFVDALVATPLEQGGAQTVSQINDYNDPQNPLGAFVDYQLFQQPDKTRESSATAYLRRILKPVGNFTYRSVDRCAHDLTLYAKTTVLRANLHRQCARPCAEAQKYSASGVEVLMNGVQRTVRARKAVVIAAGFQSALLLQRSGVGARSVLEPLGIQTLIDNDNVGKNILNHTILAVTGAGQSGSVPDNVVDPEALYTGGAFVPDVTRAGNDRASQLIGIATPPSVFTVVGLPLNATSKGTLKISSSDPLALPYFDFNYLASQKDIDTAVALVEYMRDVLLAMGLSPLVDVDTRAKAEAFVRESHAQSYHWTGSCQMALTESIGVCDNDARVFGTENLYVADISVLPESPDANTAGPALFVGSIVAEKLRRKYKQCKHCY